MTTALVLLVLATAIVVAGLAALVETLRHDAPSGSRLPRSHPADTFDPGAQHRGRTA